MKKNSWLIKILKLIGLALFLLFLVIIGSYEYISYSTQDQLVNDVVNIEPTKAAVVLGTSKRASGGYVNLYFKYRMEAVIELYRHKKIEYVIVSGDNSVKEYNEARDMKKYLVKMGIPEDQIIEDFAGFSTLDSVIRAKEVFGQDKIIIVSQPFHNERALFIANHHDIEAIGYNARAVDRNYSVKTHMREYLARVKCMLDIYVLHTMPTYYQEKESFPD